MKQIFILSLIFSTLTLFTAKAQNNVGIGTTSPQASALLDLTATDKGFLMTRVTLVAAANGTSPINSPATGLLVYNTGGALTAGFYYWNGSMWVQVGATAAPTCVTLDGAYDCGGNGLGRSVTADAGAVSITMPLSATNTEALSVISNKGTLALPTATIEAINTMPGVSILAECSSLTNTYNTIQGVSLSNYAPATGIGAGAIGGFFDGTTGKGVGIYGEVSVATGAGIAGVFGYNARTNGGYGVNGQGYAGVVRQGILNTTECFGVFGYTNRGTGVQGETNDIAFQGVAGVNYSTYGTTGNGVGVFGEGLNGVWGQTVDGNGYGVYGLNNSPSLTAFNTGVGGTGWTGVYGETNTGTTADGYGVYSYGSLGVNGNISATGTKSFIIDYPLDPENKNLLHYCIEAPVPMNMYRGMAEFDQNGEAVVTLPEYFESINTNFSYQLTPVGGYANLYIKQKIENGKFVVAGGAQGIEVSWTIIADRNDKYIQMNPNANATVVDKKEPGKLLTPEAYGKPKESGYMYRPTLKPQEISPLIDKTGAIRQEKPFQTKPSNK